MTPALLLSLQLVIAQSPPADHVETDAETVAKLQERIVQLEQRMRELQDVQNGAATDDDDDEKGGQSEAVAALQERAAALEEQVQAPAEAAQRQNAGTVMRVQATQAGMAVLRELGEILETGENDVAPQLRAAAEAFAAARTEAVATGSGEEAQSDQAVLEALSYVPLALDNSDFQEAKGWVGTAILRGSQALKLAYAAPKELVPATARR